MKGDASLTLACGPLVAALASDDAAAADWLVEFLAPSFTPTERPPEWRVRLSTAAAAYTELANAQPLDATPRPCFALDQRVALLPAWPTRAGVTLVDAERSCFMSIGHLKIEVVGDPSTRRWRLNLMRVFRELVATRLRRTHLELHAAAVERGGRGILISGPKRAGKTTLSIHLLRSGGCRPIANDRVFAGREAGTCTISGVAGLVKIAPATVAEFPELRASIPRVQRPFLYTLDELDQEAAAPDNGSPSEITLSPAQFARTLNVTPAADAPLGAIVFPQIRPDIEGWAIERLAPIQVHAALWANLYGGPPGRRTPTIFEDLDGGQSVPSHTLVQELCETVAGYRVLLGHRAYVERGGAAQMLDLLLGSL